MNKTIENIKRYVKKNVTALAWLLVIVASMGYYLSLMFSD